MLRNRIDIGVEAGRRRKDGRRVKDAWFRIRPAVWEQLRIELW